MDLASKDSTNELIFIVINSDLFQKLNLVIKRTLGWCMHISELVNLPYLSEWTGWCVLPLRSLRFSSAAEARDGALWVGGDPPPWVSVCHQTRASGRFGPLWRPKRGQEPPAARQASRGSVTVPRCSPLQPQLQKHFHVHGWKLWLHHRGWANYSVSLSFWLKWLFAAHQLLGPVRRWRRQQRSVHRCRAEPRPYW